MKLDITVTDARELIKNLAKPESFLEATSFDAQEALNYRCLDRQINY